MGGVLAPGFCSMTKLLLNNYCDVLPGCSQSSELFCPSGFNDVHHKRGWALYFRYGRLQGILGLDITASHTSRIFVVQSRQPSTPSGGIARNCSAGLPNLSDFLLKGNSCSASVKDIGFFRVDVPCDNRFAILAGQLLFNEPKYEAQFNYNLEEAQPNTQSKRLFWMYCQSHLFRILFFMVVRSVAQEEVCVWMQRTCYSQCEAAANISIGNGYSWSFNNEWDIMRTAVAFAQIY